MDTDFIQIITKVQKILSRTSARGATEAEAATAMQMAHVLLAKHGLNMGDIQAAEDRSRAKEKPIDFESGNKIADWEIKIMNATARLYFCSAIVINGNNLHMIGQRHNVVIASLMAEYFLSTIERLSKEMLLKGKKYKKQWIIGCASRLEERIFEQLRNSKKQETQVENAENLPVLASMYKTHEDANRKYMQDKWGHSRAFNFKSIKDSAAFKSGREGGNKINLNTQVGERKTGNSQKRLEN